MRATAVRNCPIELALEKRMKLAAAAWPKSRPGVTARRAQRMIRTRSPSCRPHPGARRRRAVGPGVEGAVGHHRHRQTHALQCRDEEVAPGLDAARRSDTRRCCSGFEAGQGGVLRAMRAGADEEVLRQAFDGRHQRRRAPPASPGASRSC